MGGTNVRIPTPVDKQVAPVFGENIQRDSSMDYKSDSGIFSTSRKQKADKNKSELITEDAPVATLKESQKSVLKRTNAKGHSNMNDKESPPAIETTKINSDKNSSTDTGTVKTKHDYNNRGERQNFINVTEPKVIQAASNREVRALKRQRMQEGLSSETSVELERSDPNFIPKPKTHKLRAKTHPGKSDVDSVTHVESDETERGNVKRQRRTSPDFLSLDTINLMLSLIQSKSTDICTNIEGAPVSYTHLDVYKRQEPASLTLAERSW